MRRHIHTSAYLGALVGLLLSPVFARGPAAQDRVELVGPTETIPRESYKTWSLFLVCNPEWISADRSRDVENLYWQFKVFGDAIGKENLAVWFWREKASTRDPRLAEKIDVARSAEYCRVLERKPSEGPFLVVTTAYPDLGAFPRDRAIFEFGGADPTSLAKTLNWLTDRLLLEKKIDLARLAIEKPSGQPASLPSEQNVLIQILEAGRRAIIGLGCSVKLSISAGFFNAETRGCA